MRLSLRHTGPLLLASSIPVVLAVCVWASIGIWREAYGAGPPYFSQTTNMDKWQDPTGQLLRLNGVGLVLIGVLAAAIWRTRRRSSADRPPRVPRLEG